MSNLKLKCARCGAQLVSYRMQLMHGPRGYRKYAVCVVCPTRKRGGSQKVEGKAGK